MSAGVISSIYQRQPATCKFLLTYLALILLALPAQAKVIYVYKNAPGPTYDGSSWASAILTVQEGVNASVPGDELWVAAAIYVENISIYHTLGLYGGFAGVETSRDQRNSSTNETVLDGGCIDCVIDINANQCKVAGFTIQHGYVVKYDFEGGGGIHCVGNNNIVDSNYIWYNESLYWVGGVCLTGDNNTVTGVR